MVWKIVAMYFCAFSRYTGAAHLPGHMACHDYTNKVSYYKHSGSPPKVELGGSAKRARPTSVKISRVTGASNAGAATSSSGGKKFNRKTTRSYQEDSDYLAHGTGIPRSVITL